MNALDATKIMEPEQDYKFVGTLVPPMLYFARVINGKPSHIAMANKMKLLSGKYINGYPEPTEPNNFSAGVVQLKDNNIILTRGSIAFSNYMPTEEEFTSMCTNIEYI